MGLVDAKTCLERHATSKIRSADDLFFLQTMGFRGEALASIAAVSKLQMTTALEGCEGVSISVEGGVIVAEAPSWRARGTSIEVRSLFYNVPARKKFQKSQAVSQAEITRMVTLLALAHPEVSLQLIVQKRELFSLQGGSLQQRAYALLGDSFEKTQTFSHEEKGWKVQGLLVPDASRMNKSGQYLFVNQRPVTCLPLSFAIRDAYATRLGADRHPLFVVHLTIDPGLIDVNVHPQKKEIRLQDEARLKSSLRMAVAAALNGSSKMPAIPSPLFTPHTFPLPNQRAVFPLCLEESRSEEPEVRAIGLYEKWLLIDGKSLPQMGVEGILFVDLSYAEVHLFKKHVHEEKGMQILLMPFTFSCSKAESYHLVEKLQELKELGVQMRPLGETSFIIDALSTQLDASEVSGLVESLLLEEAPLDAICRALRTRKKRYALHEAVHLLKQLLKTEDSCYLLGKVIYPLKRDVIENNFAK